MGFFSWHCAVSEQSIPAHESSPLPDEASRVVVVQPNDEVIRGLYDGYGHIRDEVIQSIGNSGDKSVLWDIYCDGDYDKEIKMVRADHYTGQKYADLPFSNRCDAQGHFYDTEDLIKILQSLDHVPHETN